MKWKKGMLLGLLLLLTGCVNAENVTMLYEIRYPHASVTATSMYEETDYNSYAFEEKTLTTEDFGDGKEVERVSIYLKSFMENPNGYKAVGESGEFVMEYQYDDGTTKIYEYESALQQESGSQIVLRSEWLEEAECFLVFVERWNSQFYTAYIDGYLEQTETYRIDGNSGEILWKKTSGSQELMLTADVTQEGETLYVYKQGAVYSLTGQQFEYMEKLGEVKPRNQKEQELLLFDLRENRVRIYYEDTPETIEYECFVLRDE